MKADFLLGKTFVLLSFLIVSFQANADFFKWELQIFSEGPGTAMEIIPVTGEETLYKWGKQGECRITKSWTRIEPELTIEGKTLVCDKGAQQKQVNLICRNNRGGRRYNRWKEIYPEPLTRNFFVEDTLPHESLYLRFRCHF